MEKYFIKFIGHCSVDDLYTKERDVSKDGT